MTRKRTKYRFAAMRGVYRATLLVLLAALAGCADRIADGRLLAAAELLVQHPDSARRLLAEADTLGMNPSERARRRVLLVRAWNRTDDRPTDDSLIRPALAYYARRGTDAERAEAWYCYGAIHDNARELEQTIRGYTTALRHAERVQGDSVTYELRAALYHNLGVLFDEQRYLTQAEAYFDRAMRLYAQLGRKDERMYSLLMKSMVLFEQHRYEEAVSLLESIREEAAGSEDPELRVFVETYLIHYRIFMQQTAPERLLDARNRIDPKDIDSLRRRNGRTLEKNASLMMYDILSAILYYNTRQIDSAALYLNRSLRAVDRFTSGTAGLLSIAGSVAMTQGKTDSAYYWSERYGELVDSIYKAERTQQVAELEQRYRSQYEMELMASRQRYQLWIFLLTGLLLLAAAGWSVAGYRRRLRRRDEQIGEYLALLESYRETHDSLTSRLQTTDAREKAVKESLESRFALIREIASTYYLYGETRRLAEKMKELALSPAMLRDVVRMADIYNDSAVTRLREQLPGWTERNYAFAALVVAGFSPQEISVMLGMTLNGVYTLKSKLKRRIAESEAPDKAFFGGFFE